MISETASRGIPPEKVAEVVHKAIASENPRHRYLVGTDAKIGARLKGTLPDRTFSKLAARQMKMPRVPEVRYRAPSSERLGSRATPSTRPGVPRPEKSPSSMIRSAASIAPLTADQVSPPPTLTRCAPASAISAEAQARVVPKASTFTGLETASQTVLISSAVTRPGA